MRWVAVSTSRTLCRGTGMRLSTRTPQAAQRSPQRHQTELSSWGTEVARLKLDRRPVTPGRMDCTVRRESEPKQHHPIPVCCLSCSSKPAPRPGRVYARALFLRRQSFLLSRPVYGSILRPGSQLSRQKRPAACSGADRDGEPPGCLFCASLAPPDSQQGGQIRTTDATAALAPRVSVDTRATRPASNVTPR